ncbi:hypothetical protein [Mesoplasma lactucae]|uniref:Uncharacterized protein n=1 Tax=Mesoplasma lactucae ATCC 49193 TaxID=81460 RepID=A0A291IRD7_9MOLU|nr:hypothetical protein [Mesoplasma lactucae]ATG97432.1 hypothetical protein CP520_01495 [Mesoplasma lactucae ATCC 49193]ATZ20115.1 type II restriction enzyme HgAI [Mesoplasma lactucae ATCC 49193]MCL8216863.1 hypothetical protein [Mesoplasma lactucae ATCC 49193]
MEKLKRTKEHRWILQKNISSRDHVVPFLDAISDKTKSINNNDIKQELFNTGAYKGRSKKGSASTMGVRKSQLAFYMFGYSQKNLKTKEEYFIPTISTSNIVRGTIEESKNVLINLFSMQYPHPYSKTDLDFEIYFGRLIISLLTEEKLNNRIYFDEFIYILNFITSINENDYYELIDVLLDYRKLSYQNKKQKFIDVPNYESIFANCLHEVKNYFSRLFSEFNVLEICGDPLHNEGHIFKFQHGNTKTFRNDGVKIKNKKGNFPGYIKLADDLIEPSKELLKKFPCWEIPISLKDPNIFSKDDWKEELYEIDFLNYYSTIFKDSERVNEIVSMVNHMTQEAKYGTKDGKSFEQSLKPVFELFRENLNVEIISGSGNTDLLCAFENSFDDGTYKINVEAKSRKSYVDLNPSRLERHISLNASKYCIVVSPRFSKGNRLDIEGKSIVALTAEVLAKYCEKECLNDKDNMASFETINQISLEHLGEDITYLVDKKINDKYGLKL